MFEIIQNKKSSLLEKVFSFLSSWLASLAQICHHLAWYLTLKILRTHQLHSFHYLNRMLEYLRWWKNKLYHCYKSFLLLIILCFTNPPPPTHTHFSPLYTHFDYKNSTDYFSENWLIWQYYHIFGWLNQVLVGFTKYFLEYGYPRFILQNQTW